MNALTVAGLCGVLLGGAAYAAPPGDPIAGKSAWEREVTAKDGAARSCVSCHGSDPRQPGRHARTGKPIAAMAPAVETQRFTDPAKEQKWFTRNCQWTWGRLCTPAEQQDIKAYLYSF